VSTVLWGRIVQNNTGFNPFEKLNNRWLEWNNIKDEVLECYEIKKRVLLNDTQ
jgi:hypothetical protein